MTNRLEEARRPRKTPDSRPDLSKVLAQIPSRAKSPRRFKGLTEVLDYSRKNLLLPRELLERQNNELAYWLLRQVDRASNPGLLQELAFSLSSKELALLFPTLTQTNQHKQVSDMISIILMRASHYLYINGWVTLQYCYPMLNVQVALSELCAILDKISAGPNPHYQNLGKTHFDENKIQEFNWAEVKLISELEMPGNRNFIANLVTKMKRKKMSLNELFYRYAIYPELKLGKKIKEQYLMAEAEDLSHGQFSPRKLYK